jgi:hypothetical protein
VSSDLKVEEVAEPVTSADTNRNDKGSAASSDLKVEEVPEQVISADTNNDDKGCVTSSNPKAEMKPTSVDTSSDDKGSAASSDLKVEEVPEQVTSADTNSDDRRITTSSDLKTEDVVEQVAPVDADSNNKGMTAALDFKDRFLMEMLSRDSFKEVIDDVDDRSYGEGGAVGDDSMNNDERLLARYQTPSFESGPATSISPSSFDGTTTMDDACILPSDTQGSTFTEDLLDRIRIALSGTFTVASFTGKSSFSTEIQKDSSTSEDDSLPSVPSNHGNHENSNIQISSADDFGDCGFEIFQTK